MAVPLQEFLLASHIREAQAIVSPLFPDRALPSAAQEFLSFLNSEEYNTVARNMPGLRTTRLESLRNLISNSTESKGYTALDDLSSYRREGHYLQTPFSPIGTPERAAEIAGVRSKVTGIEEEVANLITTRGGMAPVANIGLNHPLITNAERINYRNQLESIYRVEKAVDENGIGRVIGGQYYADVVDPAELQDPISYWYHTTYKQYYPQSAGRNATSADAIQISGNQRKLAAQDVARRHLAEGIPTDKVTIFDIETSGLDPTRHGMWQMSIRTPDGNLIPLNFADPVLSRGTVGTDIMGGGRPLSNMDDLKSGMRTLLDSEMIGGQNIDFDVDFLRGHIHRLHQNGMADNELLGMANELGAKYARGEVVDTLDLARTMFPDLPLAPELAAMGKNRVYSVENVLLQTNLIDKMAAEGKPADEILSALTKGLHDASVDTMFEQAMLGALEGRRRAEVGQAVLGAFGMQAQLPDEVLRATAHGPTLGMGLEDIAAMRANIFKTKALTPYMRMGFDEIDPSLTELVRNHGLVSRTRLPDGSLVENVRLTPAEHAMLQHRIMNPATLGGDPDVTETARRGDFFRAMARDMRDETGAIRFGRALPHDLYDSLTGKVRAAELPYASLSPTERLLSDAFSEVGAAASKGEERVVREALGSTLPITRFNMTQERGIHLFGSNKVAVPYGLLEEAEKQGIFTHTIGDTAHRRTLFSEGAQGFHLSDLSPPGYEPNISADFVFGADDRLAAAYAQSVGAPVEEGRRLLATKEAEQFLQWIKDSPQVRKQFGITSPMIEKLGIDTAEDLTARAAGMAEWGVQVGTAMDVRNPEANLVEAVGRANRTLVDLSGGISSGRDAENIVRYSVNLVPSQNETNALEGGAIHLDKAMSVQDRLDMAEARRASSTMRDRMMKGNLIDLLDESMQVKPGAAKAAGVVGEIIGAASKGGRFIREHKPTATGAILTAGAMGAYYLHKRAENRSAWFEETMAPQATQSAGVSLGTVAPSHASYDPLATAGVVRTLDKNRIGHTNMSSNRHAHLYGG